MGNHGTDVHSMFVVLPPLLVHCACSMTMMLLRCFFHRVYELRYFNIADNEGEDEE